MKIKTGIGYDVHQLAEGEELWLGGIHIEHTKGCIAHSDGDVLIHAICDALLGAAGMRDIGYHFPDTDMKYKKIDSKLLLKHCVELIRAEGYEISNIDSVLAIQSPKLKPFIDVMRQTLASVMHMPIDDISIKATTTEKLGFEGREEGVSAYATVLLIKEKS